MELHIHNANGAASGQITVADEVFARPFNETLVHQAVVAYMAGGRAGTRAQKNRSDVRGGGAKPWRQKGTGRARAGSSRSPLWRSGGVTFAARPRDYSQKINRKMYRAAMCAIFSELLRQERLRVVDALTLPDIKTKQMIARLAALGVADQQRVLLVSEQIDLNMYLSARNLLNVAISDVAGLDPVSLVGADVVVITAGAMQSVGEWLA